MVFIFRKLGSIEHLFFIEHLRVNASTISFCYVLPYSKDKIF